MRIEVTLAAAALLGSGAACAQLEADTDGDGGVSLTEFQAGFLEAAERRFQSLDSDGDGRLTGEEARARRDRDRGERATEIRSRAADRAVTRLDTDDDGLLTLAEVQAGREEATGEWFAGLDTNSDGQLSADELSAQRFGGRDRDGLGRVEIDTDGDGAWSLEEVQAVRENFTAERFNRLDDDGDGVISEAERSERRGDFRNRRGRGR